MQSTPYQPTGALPEKIDLGPLEEALCAKYAYAGFDTSVRAGHVVDAIVGQYVEFSLRLKCEARWSIVRKPADCGAALHAYTAPRFIPTHPGLYVVRVDIGGGFFREVDVVAFPKAALERMVYPETMALQRRLRLRAILRDPQVTRATIVDSLENCDSTFGLGGRLFGTPEQAIHLRNYYS